jgi:hypothetical protein
MVSLRGNRLVYRKIRDRARHWHIIVTRSHVAYPELVQIAVCSIVTSSSCSSQGGEIEKETSTERLPSLFQLLLKKVKSSLLFLENFFFHLSLCLCDLPHRRTKLHKKYRHCISVEVEDVLDFGFCVCVFGFFGLRL